MFVQVIQGPVSDAGEVRSALEGWVRDLSAGATGWLGTTAGTTADGQLVGVVRFDTEEHARANSERPEQDQWWAQTAKLFTAEPQFRESTDVEVDMSGDPSGAGFVQVMQGRTRDAQRVRAIMAEHRGSMTEVRPDVLGMLSALHDGGDYTVVNYFTSEAEARAGEQREMPPEMAEVMAEVGELEVGQPRFLDLSDPWLQAPRG